MGGTLSVANYTETEVNMSFKQLTPLYYQNNLRPGQTMYRNTGAVHFTIAAITDTGSNRYSDWDNIVPLVAIGIGAALIAIEAFAVVLLPLMAVGPIGVIPSVIVSLAEVAGFAAAIKVSGVTVFFYGVKEVAANCAQQMAFSSAGWCVVRCCASCRCCAFGWRNFCSPIHLQCCGRRYPSRAESDPFCWCSLC